MNQLLHQIKRTEPLHCTPYRRRTGGTVIGYGRALNERGLTEDEATHLLMHDLCLIEDRLCAVRKQAEKLDGVRRAALVNLAHGMGLTKVYEMPPLWKALKRKRWDSAAKYVLSQCWARLHPCRAQDVAHMLRTGEWPEADR